MKLRVLLALLLTLTLPAVAQTIPTPSEFLKMEIGADRVLADYHEIESYFEMLRERSPRVLLEDLGPTTLGERMIMAVISSEENIRNIDRLREISAALADPRGLSSQQIERLTAEGKAVVLVTCNIHSTEIASSQMAMEWAHALATATDDETRERLANVVLLLVPSLNPDGQIMIVDWYRKHVGTDIEGGPMPWLYHHYVGHDNNRDWFMLTQKETRALSRTLYHRWFPQVFVDEHQMGSVGPRMFIPPFADPMDPDVHPMIWREINLVGSNMAFRLEQQEKSGLISGFRYDAYWMGGTRNTGWWKNITGLLLEVASARIATPVYIDPTELTGGSKGLIEYKPQVNHPNPWPGGWWRLRDIMDYERIASDALLEVASKYRRDLLRGVAARATSAIASSEEREAYLIPRDQRDYPTARRLAQLLADHGVDVIESDSGDFWIPLAQPFARFIREILEPQRYPEVTLAEGAGILSPYDVSTWTLPQMMGVRVQLTTMPATIEGRNLPERLVGKRAVPSPVEVESDWSVIDGSSPEAARAVNAALASGGRVLFDDRAAAWWISRSAAPRALAEAAAAGVTVQQQSGAPPENAFTVRKPKVGIYKPWNASMDEGWTRWLLEQYGFDVVTLDNAAIRAAAVAGTSGSRRLDTIDVIVLPDISPSVIQTGRRDGAAREGTREVFPPEYRGGLGADGARAIRRWVEQGGTLVSFNSSTAWAVETLDLPVRNVLAGRSREVFNSPGSLLRATTHGSHFVTAGMPREAAIFLDSAMAFETSAPANATLRRTVLVAYPSDSRDILLSGWIRGEEQLERRAAAVAWEVDRGKAVLFGFRPQHRAQTHATFPMLFHSIWWGGVE